MKRQPMEGWACEKSLPAHVPPIRAPAVHHFQRSLPCNSGIGCNWEMKVMTEENRSIVSASTLQELISSLSTFPFMKSHLSFNQILPCYTLRLFGCIHRFLCPDVFNKRDTKGYDRKFPKKSPTTHELPYDSLSSFSFSLSLSLHSLSLVLNVGM